MRADLGIISEIGQKLGQKLRIRAEIRSRADLGIISEIRAGANDIEE